MATRSGWLAALTLFCTFFAVLVFTQTPVTGSDPNSTQRQIIDTESRLTDNPLPRTHPRSIAPTTGNNTRQRTDAITPHAFTSSNPDHDTDIPHIASDLASADVDNLLDTGQLSFELPGQADVALILASHRQTNNTDFITFTSQLTGLASTLTRRGENFFMTLATGHGSYRIEGSGEGSQVYPHQLLAQRQISNAKDFRYAANAYKDAYEMH